MNTLSALKSITSANTVPTSSYCSSVWIISVNDKKKDTWKHYSNKQTFIYYILDIFYNSYKQFIANISFHADDCQMLTNEIKISYIVPISGQADGTQK